MIHTIRHITVIAIAALAALTISATVSTAMPSPEYMSRAAAKAQQDRRSADDHAVSLRPQTGTAVAPQTSMAQPHERSSQHKPQSPTPSNSPRRLPIALSIAITLVLVTAGATYRRRLRMRRRLVADVTT